MAENNIGSRIISIIEGEKSPAIFCRNAGWTSGDISNIRKNMNSSVGYIKLRGILDAYPSVSAEWLMRGTGDMYIDVVRHEHSDLSVGRSADTIEALTLLVEQLEALKKRQDLTIQLLLDRLGLDDSGNKILK